MMLKSQQVRSLSPEMDPLRMGMGWTVDDLSKAPDHGGEHLRQQPSGLRPPEYLCGSRLSAA